MWFSLITKSREIFQVKDHSQTIKGFLVFEEIGQPQEREVELAEYALFQPIQIRSRTLSSIFWFPFTHVQLVFRL